MRARLPPSPFLYPILDLDRLRDRSPAELVGRLAAGGAKIVQLRAKSCDDRRLLEVARAVAEAARAAGLILIVNDRPDIARIVDAHGVHLGQDDLPAEEARGLLPEALIGVSTHDPEQLRSALAGPADYVAVGPVYPTQSKRDPDPVVGPALVRQARSRTTLPLVAIGGIDRRSAPEVLAAGADGLAVISDLLDAPDLEAALGDYRALLSSFPRR